VTGVNKTVPGVAGGRPARSCPLERRAFGVFRRMWRALGLAVFATCLHPGAAQAMALAGETPVGAVQVGGAAQEAPELSVPEPGAELRVWLVTIGPGEAVWERFGHNAIRLVDTRTGYDASYNWGIFDFQQEDFIPRFLRGQMLYMMAPFASEPMIEMYRAAGREVVAQELDLTPAEKLELRILAERNALPENRDYFYDYFLDNCSTRVRDLLDVVLGGAIANRFDSEHTGTSYRYHTRRLTRPDPLLFTGMDILLGSPGDRPITRWEEMFIPMTLRDALRGFTMDRGEGAPRPLVISEEVLAPARVAREPAAPPTWWPWYLALGLGWGSFLLVLGANAARGDVRARWAFGAVGSVWSLAVGLAGTILVLVLLTDHQFMTWNENLFLFSPLSLVLAPLIPLSLVRPSARGAATAVASFVVGLAVTGVVVGWMPFAVQQNAPQAALLLPVHIALWGALKGMRHMPDEPLRANQATSTTNE